MDIVERLRDWDNTTPEQNRRDMIEAADELARLRDENARLRTLVVDRTADHSHECIACHLSYTPTKFGDEDCPACGCNGTDEWVQNAAMRKGS